MKLRKIKSRAKPPCTVRDSSDCNTLKEKKKNRKISRGSKDAGQAQITHVETFGHDFLTCC